MKVKNIVFCGAMASILTMGAASATDKSDVTFNGKYSLSTDTEGTMSGTVEMAPTAGQFTYDYVNYAGEQSDVSSEHEIAYSEFKYTNSEGILTELTEDFEPEAQENYTKEIEGTRTVDNNLKVITDVTTLVSGTAPNVANYTYQRGDGEIKSLAEQPTFTETRTLLSEVEAGYVDKISISNGTETISVTNGAAETLDPSWYTLNASNGQTYHLSSDGSGVVNQLGEPVGTVGGDLDEEFAALIQAYAADNTAIAGFVSSTSGDYSTASVDYNAAMVVFNEDNADVVTLKNNFDSQATAQAQYEAAVAAQEVAVGQFNKSTANYNQAVGVYSAPILGTIDNEADERIEIALGEGGAIRTAIATGDAQMLESAQTYADNNLIVAKSYADDQDAINLIAAKAYADEGDLALNGKIENLTDSMRSADAQLRNDINALDSKVNELDENLSAGIASSVALSSVAVANVGRGEMSVGGGYGYYNSKSAVAFGAALGITDNWSANAGVGLGFGNGSKASFRVGTNYKFKLF